MLCPNCGIKVGEDESRICPHCFQKMRSLSDLQHLGAKSVFSSTSQARAIRIKRKQIFAKITSLSIFSAFGALCLVLLFFVTGLPKFNFSNFPSPVDEISSTSHINYNDKEIPIRSTVAEYDYERNKITITLFSTEISQAQRQVLLIGEIFYRVTEHQSAPDLTEIINKPYIVLELFYPRDTKELKNARLKSFNIKFHNFPEAEGNSNVPSNLKISLEGEITVGSFIIGKIEKNSEQKDKKKQPNLAWDISFNTPLLVRYDSNIYKKSITLGAQNFVDKVLKIIN